MTTLNFLLAHAVARTLEPGDEIVVTDLDHDANVSPWLLVAEDHDLVVRHAPIRTGDGTLDEDALEALAGRAHARGGVHARLERPRLDHRRRADRRRGRDASGRSRGPTPCTWRRTAACGARELGIHVLLCSPYKFFGPAPGRGRDRAGAGRVAAGGPGAPGRRVAARPPVRDGHPVPRGDRRHHGRDRIPPLGSGMAAWTPPSSGSGTTRRRCRAASSRRPRPCPGSSCTGSPIPSAWVSARPLSASTSPAGSRGGSRPSWRRARSMSGTANYYALAPMRALGLAERGAVRAGFLHYTTEDEVDRLPAALADLSGRA